jgi:CRISPR-associated protein Cmr4
MTLWPEALLTAVYTLTPTHCGTGQTTGAVDLPIARDAASELPILPPTTLKGVARDHVRRGRMKEKDLLELFGPELEEGGDVSLSRGRLSFTEGQLLAYPARALARPFLHVTSPLLLERLRRLLLAVGVGDFFPEAWRGAKVEPGRAFVTDEGLAGRPLVVEDLVYEGGEVGHFPPLTELARRLAGLIPAEVVEDRDAWVGGLVLLPDADLVDLVERAVPVQARIKLSDRKTSDNLWYEESLPADCLFFALIGAREGEGRGESGPSAGQHPGGSALATLREHWDSLSLVQIGGNETVGQGLCSWSYWQEDGSHA